ncbi:riboflavin kinase [Microstroma glucosiphilum]|uniref:Riboflavin kinase n=1 Tax=Pseudomicrostroma glucosiphilum TaxID=1684307 RepID=A0A316U8H2_9BASI|nr:riboflavin kinase [Pseudomicrostroma glucosiphilum]PWN21462.1 riboflavin kinase [Pseudomicrostroma glucosiphilum]
MSDPTASSSSSISTAADAPPAALQAPTDRSSRPQVIGDAQAGPSAPFPIYLSGVVQRGFGRGGKELGCPTANLPSRLLKKDGPTRGIGDGDGDGTGGEGSSDLGKAPTGVYFGWARLISAREGGRGEEYEDQEQKEKKVERDAQQEEGAKEETSLGSGADLQEEECVPLPMVMSLGWNPFYANKTKTAEVHIMHPFSTDFYGLQIRVIVLGYIRPEYNYTSLDALKDDIEMDKRVALNSVLPADQRPAWAKFKEDPFFFSEVQPASKLGRSGTAGAAGAAGAAVKGGAAL